MKILAKKLFRAGLGSLGYEINKVAQSSNDIHFLHIGKCAGTQIERIISEINDFKVGGIPRIVKRNHDIFLRDLPPHVGYFFSIRDPISRFKSGFYSKKRKGQPRRHSEWTKYEAFAFSHFDEANDLAEALFLEGRAGNHAAAAINSIRHTSQNQSDWFYCSGSFLFVRPPIYIIRQENFQNDCLELFSRIGIQDYWPKVSISSDFTLAHANDYSRSPDLSPLAVKNLMTWYAQDLAFHRMCVSWIEAGGRP